MKQWLLKVQWCGMVSVALCGCSSERIPEELVGHIAQAVTGEAGTQLPGYVHNLSRSHFRIGNNTALEVSSLQLQRWRGSLGAFAVDPTTGWSMAILDATTPTGPYLIDEPTHSAAVKAYFIGAGLPPDQIGDTMADYVGSGGLSVMSLTPPSSPPQVDSINSVLTRVADGIRVVESFAWAKMTSSHEVDMEAVFWPPLDMAVVNGAVSLASNMTNGAFHAAFLGRLPGTVYKDVGVVIHHTSPAIHSAPVAYVAYDVVLDASKTASVRHFDATGAEFRLPHEILGSPTTQTRGR